MGKMKHAAAAGWSHAGSQAWSLAGYVARVAQLRTARIARGGPDALTETWLMITEKWQAAAELQSAAA